MNKFTRGVLCSLLCIGVFFGSLSGGTRTSPRSSQVPQAGAPGEVVPGVVIVKFKRGFTAPSGALQKGSNAVLEAMRLQGVVATAPAFRVVRHESDADAAAGKIDLSQIHVAAIDRNLDPRAVARQLGSLPQVEYAEPKYVHHICDVPNDANYAANQQLYFDRMNAAAGWSVAKGSPSAVIATVDGGTNWQHPDLEQNLWINAPEDINHDGIFEPASPPAGDDDGVDEDGNGYIDDVIGWNFGANSNNPRGVVLALANHGTGTASVFGAVTNNGTGMAGSSWNCRVMPICVSLPSSTNSVDFPYEGIQYAFMNGAKIINCSWERGGPYSQFEQDVITAATQAGSLIVAAAGNDVANNDNIPVFPATYRHVLSVGATQDVNDVKASFSNYGANVTVFAPGTNIWLAQDNGGYAAGSGTSFSSPLVAGLAGILKSAHPTWTPDQIRVQIRVTADSVDGSNPAQAGLMARGRVNFGRALSESHPGIDIISSSIFASSGQTAVLQGDTLVLRLTVANILNADASGLTFTASVADPSLQILNGSASVSMLASGQQVTLSDLTFKVGSLTSSKIVPIRVNWVSNSTDRDAASFRAYLFASAPLWLTQASATSDLLSSVKAVNSMVVWAVGAANATAATGPVVVRTTDGGQTWTDVTAGLTGPGLYCVAAVDGNHAWAGTSGGAIFATSNGGVSWSQQAYPGTQSAFIDGLWFFDANNGYALGDPAAGTGRFVVLKTTDGGTTWAHLANEPLGSSSEAGWNNSFWWNDPGHGWFGTNNTRVWRTTDGGGSWSAAASPGVNSVGVSFNDNSTGLVAHDNGVVGRTTDGGQTWASVASPTSAGVSGICYVPGSGIAWLTDGVDLFPYRSNDNGSSWVPQSAYPVLGTLSHISLADTGNGWIVTSQGEVLGYHPSGTTGVKPLPQPSVPGRYVLEQNYPNPFNPTTKIQFTIVSAQSGSASGGNRLLTIVNVYDVLGREVATLVNEVKEPGTYTVQFSGSGLASGVYFYRLQAGTYVETRKLLLLK
jgi:subtilisin family serine protease